MVYPETVELRSSRVCGLSFKAQVKRGARQQADSVSGQVCISPWACLGRYAYSRGRVLAGMHIPVGVSWQVCISPWACLGRYAYSHGRVWAGMHIPVGVSWQVCISPWACLGRYAYSHGRVWAGMHIPVASAHWD